MSRFRSFSQADDDESAIDISPLIDCVFILLIFFIVTTTFVEETGVTVDKPEAAGSTQLEKNSVLIAITSDGDVMHGNRSIGVGGVRSAVKRGLIADKSTPVIIQADKGSQSDTLVKVVGEAKIAGAVSISVATGKGGRG
ncbi:MAG: ExbD/TolR family protein [Planctomycetota bacterium]|jgi:biopolymer transport protein ExbD